MKLDLTRLPVGEMMVGFLIVSLLVTFILAFTLVDSGTGVTDGAATDITSTPISGSADIAMGDNFFDPNDITVAAGDTVTFNLTNGGVAIHNMHIAQPDGNYSVAGICEPDGGDACSDPNAVPAGQTAALEWEVPDAPGTEIPFRCDFHPVEMTGTITIQ
jgi:plastocyanin